VYTQAGSHRVQWSNVDDNRPALTWYKVMLGESLSVDTLGIKF